MNRSSQTSGLSEIMEVCLRYGKEGRERGIKEFLLEVANELGFGKWKVGKVGKKKKKKRRRRTKTKKKMPDRGNSMDGNIVLKKHGTFKGAAIKFVISEA